MKYEKGTPQVLVTGFGPFPGQPDNPTARMISELKHIFHGRAVDCHVLPTEYDAGFRRFSELLDQKRPDIVLCFGVAAQRRMINLERIAYNERAVTLPDAAGYRPETPQIDRMGPDRYRATLPLRAIRENLREAGLNARYSDDAGRYLCNFFFYQLMHRAGRGHGVKMGGFIHVPDPGRGHMSHDDLLKAGQIAVNACLGCFYGPR